MLESRILGQTFWLLNVQRQPEGGILSTTPHPLQRHSEDEQRTEWLLVAELGQTDDLGALTELRSGRVKPVLLQGSSASPPATPHTQPHPVTPCSLNTQQFPRSQPGRRLLGMFP